MIQTNLQNIIDSIKLYEENKKIIIENIDNFSDEELTNIFLEVSEENNLTEDQTEELIKELFGIGNTVANVATKAKTIGVKVASPFKVAGSYVKGLADRVKAKSQEMDDAAAQRLYKSRETLNKTKADVTRKVKKAYSSGYTGKSSSGQTKPSTSPAKPSSSKGAASLIRSASSGIRRPT